MADSILNVSDNVSLLSFVEQGLGSSSFEILPLAGDASTRKYYRIVKDSDSWVLMCWEPFESEENYPFLSVHRHFQASGSRVPKVVKVSPQLGMVLLEDLGDLTLERKFWENQNQQLCLPYYYQAIDELIKMHFVATKKGGDCTAFGISFDTKKLLWEMNYGREHLIEKLCEQKLSPSENNSLDQIFLEICENLDREPKWIAHRDYHSRNLMIKLGKVYVIDFQDARMGPIQYDLVSLLYDSYVKLNAETKQDILNYYLKQAGPYLPKDFDLAHFQHIMDVQILQRCFKACGSFSSFYNQRGDQRYLKYLQPTLKLVIDKLEVFPKYKDFRDILKACEPLTRKFAES